MAIKSKELAKLLGVSTATMSLVLNHKPGISDELRGSLLSRIQEMGYGYMIKEAEEAETGGSAVSAKNIAYIILADHQEEGDEGAFFPPVIEGAEREARRLGYHFSIIHMYDEKAGRLRESIKKEQYLRNGIISAVPPCLSRIRSTHGRVTAATPVQPTRISIAQFRNELHTTAPTGSHRPPAL